VSYRATMILRLYLDVAVGLQAPENDFRGGTESQNPRGHKEMTSKEINVG
jgi:hypothetical protein